MSITAVLNSFTEGAVTSAPALGSVNSPGPTERQNGLPPGRRMGFGLQPHVVQPFSSFACPYSQYTPHGSGGGHFGTGGGATGVTGNWHVTTAAPSKRSTPRRENVWGSTGALHGPPLQGTKPVASNRRSEAASVTEMGSLITHGPIVQV